MPSESTPSSSSTAARRVPVWRAVRHHLPVVVCFLALGALLGWTYFSTVPRTWTSTARVLVNPSTGNPYAPTPVSVRQDELTSLETEAEVARSAEVLGGVAADLGLATADLEQGVEVVVPANTQVLQISYSASEAAVARDVADAVATLYLENRDRRFRDVNAARIERVENRTDAVVRDLRAATAAAQTGDRAVRLFQRQLADALSNELVSLRAQRTALENSETPGGSVVSPASTPAGSHQLTAIALPVGGALAGLALGCLIALLLERTRGTVRAASEVEAAGLPVVAAVPAPKRRDRWLRRDGSAAVEATIRRLRAHILDREPRPDVIAITPAGAGTSDAVVSEAVAASFARAGHRVVLVQTDGPPATGGLAVDDLGLAQALLHDGLRVMDMLQPSVEPLLCLLPDGGFTAQSRELLVSDRLRQVLSPLVNAGHLVVIQSPGIDTAEGEAFLGAADLGLVTVTLGRTRPQEVEQVTAPTRTTRPELAALVVRPSRSARRVGRARDLGRVDKAVEDHVTDEETVARDPLPPAGR